MSMIITAECEECRHGELFFEGKIEKVKCLLKEKEYYYGQCIQCDNKSKRTDSKERKKTDE